MNKNISITKYTVFGSTGFLGNNFKNYLKKKKYQVFCPSKKDYKFKKNLGHVFYCAGTSESITNPDKALKANLIYLNNILLNNNFESFTYFSSIRVYSSNKSTHENSKILCDVSEKGIYFKNLKLAAESLCLQFNNPKIRIIRLSNLYGDYFNKQIYLMPTIIRNIKNKKKIILSISPFSKKNYLHVEDAIKVSIKISHKGKFRIYNVASKSMITINEIFKLLKKTKKFDMSILNYKKINHEPKININRIEKEFKFFEKKSFDQSFLNLIKNNYK
jgi:nucleoside-diphosphate-sugar epimerase